MILERSAHKAEEIDKKGIATVSTNPEDLIPRADLIILAVKPQDVVGLFESIKPFIHKDHVILSIMAGIQISKIKKYLGVSKVVRAMPNLPAQTGMGMTVFTSSEEITRLELVMIQNLLNTTGKSIYVAQEEQIDSATAISGSGPAYVYFFMEAMIKAAKEMGFTNPEAELLVSQTFLGAIDLYKKNDFTCREWIEKVSSKGGTTEHALNKFEDTQLHNSILMGMHAAFKRAKELRG
jgi:pyrroline-5-carboxylate reductase